MKIFYVLMFLSCCLCCTNTSNEKIVFPDNFISAEIGEYIQKHDYIVIVYVDSIECTSCSMRHLSAWRAFARKMKQYNTGLLLITDNSDENAITFSLKSLRFSFPFIIDKGKKFKSKNSSVIGIAQDNTFVINKTENVIFTSSPIENEERWNTFVRLIKH